MAPRPQDRAVFYLRKANLYIKFFKYIKKLINFQWFNDIFLKLYLKFYHIIIEFR